MIFNKRKKKLMHPALLLTRNSLIPLTLRKKIGKLIRVPPATDFTIPMPGSIYQGRTGNHMDDKIYLYGMHEAATIRLMRKILSWQRKNGLSPVLLDIGANAGQHLLASATAADHAYGFEPWEPVRSRAMENLALNGMMKVGIFPFGLSDENAQLSYTPPAANNLGVGSFSAKSPEALKLEVRRGDDILKEHGIIPTLLKIDVEGFERRVLTGLRDTIARYRPAIIFEHSDLSRGDFDTKEKRYSLFGPGYSFYGIRRSREFPALAPFRPEARYENVLAWPEVRPLLL